MVARKLDEHGCVVWVPRDLGASCLDGWNNDLDAGDAGDVLDVTSD